VRIFSLPRCGLTALNRLPAALIDSAAALSVQSVSHAYGARKALDDVSFTVGPATFAVLLGLNGAGKSTLFAILTHLYAARSGVVRIFGHDMARDSRLALAELGVVFQTRTLDPYLTVEQNMLYQGALHGMKPRQTRTRSRDLLASVGLADAMRSRVRTLSGGQMRRVEIARALLHEPRLVLLDEPTAGLDVRARADILALVRELVARDRVSVLWTTHLVDEVRDDDQVIVLHKGRVRALGLARDVTAATGTATIADAFAWLALGAGRDV
jgi:ABC-2 type transport system ATP-binding protein